MSLTIDDSSISVSELAEMGSVSHATIRRWFRYGEQPGEKHKKKYEVLMKLIENNPRLKKHPSYGYATPEQIEQLEKLGLGPERDRVLKAIQEQTTSRGKQK